MKEPENNKTDACDRARINVITATKHVLSGVGARRRQASRGPATKSPCATGPEQWGVKTTAKLIDRLRSEYEHVIIAAPRCCRRWGRPLWSMPTGSSSCCPSARRDGVISGVQPRTCERGLG